jgi:predicted phage terminase large subunit-like protein
MVTILCALVSIFEFRVRSRASLELELIALRHQVTVLRRQRPGRPRLSSLDRLLWVWLYRIWPQVIDAMVLVKPTTVVQWHRKGFRLYWRWRSRRPGRPKQERIYLLHVLRKRMGYPDLKRAVREQWQAFKPSVILIEDKASGTQLIQELLEEGIHAVTRYTPEYDKVMRMHAQTGVIDNGFVYLPKEAHWLPEYLYELAMFPNGKYDDQIDSTSQALAWTKQRPPGWGILEYYRQQVENMRNPPERYTMVRVKPPTQFSNLYTMSGRNILPRPDGSFEVSLEDAKPLLMAGWQQISDAA